MGDLSLKYESINLKFYGINFDLQRFASAESEGRTEKATEHKKRKAREEGRVALSKEIPASVISIIGFSTVALLAVNIFEEIVTLMLYVIENITTIDIRSNELFYNIFLFPFIKSCLPVALTIFVIALISNYAQIGFQITPKGLKADFKKVMPDLIKYVKNQIISPQGAFNLIKSIVKVLIIFFISYITINGYLERIIELIYEKDIIVPFIFTAKVTLELAVKASVVLLVFAFADLIFVKWNFEESLKMKKEEIKEEQKELYGDPQVKAKIKQAYQMMMSQEKMLKDVPNADVVITNPTHYAVAIRYDKSLEDAPRVIAKGEDEFAQKIKAVARANDIYTYENVMLARQLYGSVEVNDIIPSEYWGFVITALKLAYQFGDKNSKVNT